MSMKYVQEMAAFIDQKLVGGVITSPVVAEESKYDCAHFGFEVRLPSGEVRTVWVVSDPEGNDTGFLEVEDQPSPVLG
jgi:hypothetical protein